MTKEQTTTLRPGLLVVMKTSITGNVKYDRVDIDEGRDGNVETTEWQTKRTINDVSEWKRARKAVTVATSPIKKVCRQTAFGLMCPVAERSRLQKAIEESTLVVEDFNCKAKLTQICVNVLRGEVAADDVEAIKAINGQVRSLMSTMEAGLKNLDVKAVRAAASKARDLGQMLTPEAQTRVAKAIELARKSASSIAKAGENVTVEIDRQTIKKIAAQRTSFIDMSDEPVEVKTPKARSRKVDLGAVA